MSSLAWVGPTFPSTVMQQAVWDEDFTIQYSPRFNWSYQKRGAASVRDAYGHFTLWPSARIAAGDPTAPLTLSGQDAAQGGIFTPSMYAQGGVQRPWFIRGNCVDGSSNPVPGAVIQGFLTANDQYVGQTITDDGGYYQLGTYFFGQQHYLIAYKPGSPDIAGTTVNTLTPVV